MGWRMCHVFMPCSGSPWLCTRQTILKSAPGASPVESPSQQNTHLWCLPATWVNHIVTSAVSCQEWCVSLPCAAPSVPWSTPNSSLGQEWWAEWVPGLAGREVALPLSWPHGSLSSISQAEGGEGNLGQSSGKQTDRSVPRLRWRV